MNRLINKFFQIIINEFCELICYVSPKKSQVLNDIPYFSQWESPILVSKILRKEIPAKNDPLWRNSGAKTAMEYEFWSWHICGMACLKMLLKSYKSKDVKTIELAKAAAEFKAYVVKKDDIQGLVYQPFCLFLKEKFKIDAVFSAKMSLKRIIWELSRGNSVIASVHPSIRSALEMTDLSRLQHRGGHLVLMTGYDDKKKVVYFHNPSGVMGQSQSNNLLPYELFNRYFAHRGIILSGNSLKNISNDPKDI